MAYSGFHLWQSVILKLQGITTTGAYTESSYKVENYEVSYLGNVSSQAWYLVIPVEQMNECLLIPFD